MIYVTHDQVEALTFADKVLVMYEGELIQIGAPQELFEKPSHKFVGYFIGSPGMNFLPCEVEGATAYLNGTHLTLSDELAKAAASAEGRLELGVRPLYIQIHRRPVENGVEVRVIDVEDQGSFRIVTCHLAGHTVRARLPEGEPAPEGEAWLVFPPEWTRLYENGRLVG
jgi:glycerol transport system ATP-binding protein